MPTRFAKAVLAFLFSLGALADTATKIDPEHAWREFLVKESRMEPRYRFPHAPCFKQASLTYDLPEALLLAVARGESDFVPTARSKANAHGVMQIRWPTTAKHLGIYMLSSLYDPCTNIDAGARYLRELIDRFDGNLHLALAAYNYGPERIATNVANIPTGASWYSGYIYRHLRYVLGNGPVVPDTSPTLYSELGKSTLVEFAEPYRAAAFVARLEANAPDVSLDWFRKDVGRFSVVMSYEDKDQFNRSATLLARAGFPLP